jgi:hypothetical protein
MREYTPVHNEIVKILESSLEGILCGEASGWHASCGRQSDAPSGSRSTMSPPPRGSSKEAGQPELSGRALSSRTFEAPAGPRPLVGCVVC